MSAALLKKQDSALGFPAAARFFEELTEMFASAPAAKAPRIVPKQLRASLNALKDAPDVELAAVNAVLKEISSQVSKLVMPEAPPADEAIADAKAEKSLAGALARQPHPMVTEKSIADGAAFMEKFRAESAAALLERIERREMLTSAELQSALSIGRQSVSDAVKAGRLFAVVGPAGANFYPAFYADPSLDRRAVEKVSKALGTVPGASKYHFFTAASHMLGMTPLEALRKGRLPEVLTAAAGFADR